MARGPSGRLVIEIDPDFKRELHAAFAAEGITLKDWFLREAQRFLVSHKEPDLPGLIDYRSQVPVATPLKVAEGNDPNSEEVPAKKLPVEY